MEDYLNDEHPGEYFYELVLAAPTLEELLDELRQGDVFRYYLSVSTMPKINDMSIIPFSESECNMLIDPTVVEWDEYHTSILESVSNCRATNKHNSAIRSKKYINYVEDAADRMKRSYPDSIANDERKRTVWTSCIVALASDFESRLALGLHHRGVNSLKERIKNVLAQNWVPDDEEHAEKIYYVSGFVLRVIERLGERAKGEVATVLDDILSNARATKEEAKESDLPTRLTEVKEKVSLFYVNKSFYKMMVKVESVFHHLMSEEGIARHGIDIVNDICHVLSQEDIGFKAFVPETVVHGDYLEAVRRFMRSFGRLRGKDWVRRRKAQRGYIFNEAMRATLGVIAAERKKKAQTRGKKGKGKKISSRNVSDKASSASPTVPAEQLALDPSHLGAAADEAMDTGHRQNATTQDQANGNDNEFDVYDDAFDEFVMQEEELLLAKFAEYRTIVDKSVGN